MASTIVKRKRKDGTFAYRADVTLMQNRVTVFKKVKTFDSSKEAKDWIREMEIKLKKTPPKARDSKSITLREGINLYINKLGLGAGNGLTRRRTLTAIGNSFLGSIPIEKLSTQNIIAYVRERQSKDNAGPATIGADLSYMNSVIRYLAPLENLDIDVDLIRKAKAPLAKDGAVGSSRARNRRVIGNEVDRLLDYFRKVKSHPRSRIPMEDVIEFAIFSARRRGEIFRITWDDFDETARTLIVRNVKDPKKKKGNDMTFPVLGKALDIILRQPKVDARIFPYNEQSVSVTFWRACKALGIEGLRFHDLRRESASRLFEMGFTPVEVASVTGHKNLDTLNKHYTKLFPETIHSKFDKIFHKEVENEAVPAMQAEPRNHE